jgi:GNAT superfamily N-acetyltransferase
MVLTQFSDSQSQTPGQARPLNLNRDVPEVMQLLRLVFSATLDADGRRALNSMSTTPTTLLRLNQFASGTTPGFVWEIDGKIVGNISIIPTRHRNRTIIANVAVHPDNRRQGIALALMQTALQYLSDRRVETVMLQVDVGNDGARRLYEQLGFAWLGAMTAWRANSLQWKVIETEEKYTIRPLRSGEARTAFAIDTTCVNRELCWPEPLREDTYRLGWFRRLDNMFSGKQFEAWTIPSKEGVPLAVAKISGEWGRPHRITLRVPDQWQNELTRPLFAKLLRRLRFLRQRSVIIEHPHDDVLMNALLREANFRPKRTLGTMKLEI